MRRLLATVALVHLLPTVLAVTSLAPDPVGVWPLSPEPAVARGFEPPPTPYAAGHRGADLLGSAGAVVGTALPGTVTFAGSLAGRGVVVVSHGATRTTYEPVAATVAVGAVLVAGAPIGTLQAGPSHCSPRTCLHWGWVEGDTYLDPLRLVGAGPVRLLPLEGLGGLGGLGVPATVAPPVPGARGAPLVPLVPPALLQALGWAWR